MTAASMFRPAPWFLPALAIAALFWVTHPGYLSFDSAVAFWSARQDRYVDISGVLLPKLWHWMLGFSEGTTGIRVLLGTLLSVGFGWLGSELWRTASASRRWVAALVLPLCPVFLIVAPHIWSDVLLLACLLWASASAASLNRVVGPKARAALVAILLLSCLAATLTRHNALLALPPILWWGLMPLVRSGFWRTAACGFVLALLALTAGTIRDHTVTTRLDTWAVTFLYDLQAVSIATRTDDSPSLIPPQLTGPGLKVAELRAAWHPYSATRLFSGTQSGVSDPTVAPLTPEQSSALRSAWILILDEPAYWQQRWRLTEALWGTYREPMLRGQAEHPGQSVMADNPVLEVPQRAAAPIWRTVVDKLFRVGAAAPVLYVGLAILSMLVWRPSGARMALMASAFLYAAPYAWIAPSAELRYLLWPCVAAWIVFWLGVLTRRVDPANADVG
ncbi:MAG: hypothetical protein IPK97_08315 [Ahniella sp.]|nr:hypothetical protein [Ahniella sp.]